LPENLYVIPDIKDASFGEKREKHDEIMIAKVEQKSIKEMWGPNLFVILDLMDASFGKKMRNMMKDL
jgi:hypothetical protein